MITVKSSQRKIPINVERIKKTAAKMLAALDYEDFDLGILFTTNKTIHWYNKMYRDKDKPTDILSFPFHPKLKPGKRIVAKTDDDKNLGDLIISPEYVMKDAAITWNRTFDEHLTALLAHGIAHLLGYDHETDAEFAVMRRVENKLIKAVLK